MMYDIDVQKPAHPAADTVVGAITDWINRHRGRANDTFWRTSPDEVQQVAHDLGISVGELRDVVSKGPRAADLMQKMLAALGLDAATIAKSDPATMRDLQRLCSACRSKGRCEHELAKGSAAAQFRKYCPNSFTLDALVEQKHLPFQH
jgi:uncharacterized protein DUF6455